MFGTRLSLLRKRENSEFPLLLRSIGFRLSIIQPLADLYTRRVPLPNEQAVLRSLAHGELPPLLPYHYIGLLRLFVANLPIEYDESLSGGNHGSDQSGEVVGDLLYWTALFDLVRRTTLSISNVQSNINSLVQDPSDTVLRNSIRFFYNRWYRPMVSQGAQLRSGRTPIEFSSDPLRTGRMTKWGLCTNPGTTSGVSVLSGLTPVEGVARRVLCLDGGGMRGLFILAMLRTITRKKYGNSDVAGTRALMSNFDLVSGTSTGAIIAAWIRGTATAGGSIDEIIERYFKFGERVFSKQWSGYPGQLYSWARKGAYYDHRVLTEQVEAIFGTERVATLSGPTLLVATNKSSSEFEPYVFRNYHSLNSHLAGTEQSKVVTAIRASTAAPSYFQEVVLDEDDSGVQIYKKEPPKEPVEQWRLGEKLTMIDGGMIANNPTELTVFEARHLWPNDHLGLIVSLGTGQKRIEAGYTSLLGFEKDLLGLVTSSKKVHQRIQEWIEVEKIGDNVLKYLRFDPEQLGSVPLDCTDRKILESGMAATETYLLAHESFPTLLEVLR